MVYAPEFIQSTLDSLTRFLQFFKRVYWLRMVNKQFLHLLIKTAIEAVVELYRTVFGSVRVLTESGHVGRDDVLALFNLGKFFSGCFFSRDD